MGMKAPVTGSGDRAWENPPAGSYLGACNGVYMLGTQPGYNGGDASLQVMLSFQLFKRKGPVKDSGDRIFEMSRIMNFTANIKSTLIDYAGAMRGIPYTEEELAKLQLEGGFDAETLVGLSCKLNVVHEKKGEGVKAKIKSVAPLDPEDDVAPKVDGDEIYWDWNISKQCPKRIEYFWKRAVENPDADRSGTANGKPANPSDVDKDTVYDEQDAPF